MGVKRLWKRWVDGVYMIECIYLYRDIYNRFQSL